MRKILFTICFLTVCIPIIEAQVRIKMIERNGVFMTPCIVNGLKLNFIFDTGASSVSISLSEALFMLKNGYLEESDLKGSSFSQLANGTIVENSSLTLKEIEIGGLKIFNIEAIIIHELSSPLLLGQSAIQKLGKFQLDGDELVLYEGVSTERSTETLLYTRKIVEQAGSYYNDDNFYLAIKSYQKAFDLYPSALYPVDLFNFAFSYHAVENYQNAIDILKKLEILRPNFEEYNYFIYNILADSYQKLENYKESNIYAKQALYVSSNDDQRFICYYQIASNYFLTEDYISAIYYSDKVIDNQLKRLDATEEDVYKGKINDLYLGIYYSTKAWSYHYTEIQEKFKQFLILSALCGDDYSIKACKENAFTY